MSEPTADYASPLSGWLLASRREPLDLPGAPARLYVRELLAEDLLAMPSDSHAGQWAIIAACLVDGADHPVLTADQARRLPRAHYQAIIDAVNRLNGWGAAQVEEAVGE